MPDCGVAVIQYVLLDIFNDQLYNMYRQYNMCCLNNLLWSVIYVDK